MSLSCDLAVLGDGPGSHAAALRAAHHGLDTILVVPEPDLGTGAIQDGVVLVESLVHAAAVWRTCRHHASRSGIIVGEMSIDGAQVLARSRAVARAAGRTRRQALAQAGVRVVCGQGRLRGPGRLVVAGAPGTTEEIAASRIVLAGGARPATVSGISVDGARVLTPGHLQGLDRIPSSLIVVGAGAAGVELATAFAAFGCRVTLVEMQDRILPGEDPEAAALVQAAMREQGLTVRTAARAIAAAADDHAVVCTLLDIAGRTEETLGAESLLVAAGRRAGTRDLGLETVNVQTDRLGCLLTDCHQRTATEGLYAIGDVTPTPRLTHLARREAIQAVDHAVGRARPPIRHQRIPRGIRSHPELAAVGLTVAEAEAEGRQVRVGRAELKTLDLASNLDEPPGFVKVVADTETGRPVGVHMVGDRALAVIAGPVTALGLDADLSRWSDVVQPHPALNEAVHAAMSATVEDGSRA